MNLKTNLRDYLEIIETSTKQICLNKNNKNCCGGGKPFCHSIENCRYKTEVILVNEVNEQNH